MTAFTFLGYDQTFTAVDNHMQACVEAVKKNPSHPQILACSYRPTVTLGVRSVFQSEVRLTAEELAKKGVACVMVKRGGQATFQGPGQLAFYPIIHLPSAGLSVRQHLARLIAITQKTVAPLVSASCTFTPPSGDGLGVWVNGKKIGFLGVRIQKGVSSYGLNLNICDGDGFSFIHPCGRADLAIGSVEEFAQSPIDRVVIAKAMARAYGWRGESDEGLLRSDEGG